MLTLIGLIVTINNVERLGKTATMAIGCSLVAASAIRNVVRSMTSSSYESVVCGYNPDVQNQSDVYTTEDLKEQFAK